MDTKSLGQKLREYRARRGWSQDACAERMGITTRYLSDIERGDKAPRLATFIRMCNVLDASADDVLQNSLRAGRAAKSNDLLRRMEDLEPAAQRQALEILERVVEVLRAAP